MQILRTVLLGLLLPSMAAFGQSDKKPEKTDAKAPITSKSSGMKLMPIPAGTFMMGASEKDTEALLKKFPGFPLANTWQPQHKVEVSEFYMGVNEVTQAEFKKVLGRSGTGMNSGAGKDQFPVIGITWFDTLEFCNKLSEKDGLTPRYKLDNVKREDGAIASATVTMKDGKGYRLPTEAEWEYACRAGTTTPFNTGDKLTPTDANFDGRTITKKTKVLAAPKKVGSFKKNAFGLFDMHGNIAEYCFDTYTENPYRDRGELTKDPVVATEGESKVLRGGDFDAEEWQVYSYSRQSMQPNQPWGSVGFRVVRDK